MIMTRYVDGHSDVGSSSLLSYSTTLLEMSRKPVIMKQDMPVEVVWKEILYTA